MNRFVENTISAAGALLLGFYVGTQWNKQEPAAIPAELRPELPAAQVEKPAAAPPPVSTVASRPIANVAQPKPSAYVQPPQAVSPAPEPPPQRVAHTETVPGFDSKKLDAVQQQSKSEDAQQRREALLILAKLGTENVLPDLIRAAANDEESSSLRRELIQQIDWSGHAEELAGIISKSRDAEARLAAVNAISAAKNFTEEEFAQLGDALMNNFLMEPEEGIKIATLNCIQENWPGEFQKILEKYPKVLATPEVQNHLKMITTTPEQMEEAPAAAKSEEQGE